MTRKALESSDALTPLFGDGGVDWAALDLNGLVTVPGPSAEEREERLAAASPLSGTMPSREAPSTLASGDTTGEGLVDPSDDWGLPR